MLAKFLVAPVSAVLLLSLGACSSEPENPVEAVQQTWDSFTPDQQTAACEDHWDGRSTYSSSYISERAVKLFPRFVEGDLYEAAGDLIFGPDTQGGVCDNLRPEESMSSVQASEAEVESDAASTPAASLSSEWPEELSGLAFEGATVDETKVLAAAFTRQVVTPQAGAVVRSVFNKVLSEPGFEIAEGSVSDDAFRFTSPNFKVKVEIWDGSSDFPTEVYMDVRPG